MTLIVLAAAACLGSLVPPPEEIATETVEYSEGNVVLEGYLAYPRGASGRLPGVLVCHQWMGLSEHERRRADETAKLGCVAFALDLYGKGNRPQNPAEAAKVAAEFKGGNRSRLRARALAGLEVLRKESRCDPNRIAVMGYCFGGTVALELARLGGPIAAAVSFHGDLSAPPAGGTAPIRCRILAFHGADDPFVPPAQVSAFEEEMRRSGADWQLVAFGGAVHGFTMKAAGEDPSHGVAYNRKADLRSWQMYRDFLAELFAKP